MTVHLGAVVAIIALTALSMIVAFSLGRWNR